MKKDNQTIWREAGWTFQARNIIQGLNQFPLNAKIVLFIRHSHRKESNNAKELKKLGLTSMGCEIAKIFGTLLPKERKIRLFHSPSPRCVETARKIQEGFQEIGGISENLGAVSPLNDVKSSKGFIASQTLINPGFEFIERWHDKYYSNMDIIPFSEYCINVHKKIMENSKSTEESGLNIHITHDLFIIALRKGFFNLISDLKWVSFLGGFAISLDKNQYLLLDIEQSSLELIRSYDKKKIPIFKINHKGSETNGKKK
ncbi:MAG: histidine phosphatase family protein [Promethearchaeota archaeon]